MKLKDVELEYNKRNAYNTYVHVCIHIVYIIENVQRV